MHLRTLFFTNPNCSISLLALRYSPSYSPSQSKNDKGIARRFLTQPYTTEKVGFGGRGEFFFGWPLRTDNPYVNWHHQGLRILNEVWIAACSACWCFLRACLRGERVTLVLGNYPASGLKLVLVYKQISQVGLLYHPGQLYGLYCDTPCNVQDLK